MAKSKKPEHLLRVKIVSPKGVAVYPRLAKPDTKFNAEGIYSVRLRVPADVAQPLCDQIDAIQQKAFDGEKARLVAEGEKAKAKTLKMAADKPYKPAVDKDGDETGEIEFNFKMKSQYKDKEGNIKKRKPEVVDSKGSTINGGDVWGGSELKVGGYLDPFSTAIGVGVSLKLGTVAVYKLVSGSKDSFDFGDEEGYTKPEDDEESTTTAAATDSSDDSGDEF